MAKQALMKEGLNKAAIRRISCALKAVHPSFKQQDFESECVNGLSALELKARIYHIIEVMHRYLPSDFEQTAALLLNIKPVWDKGDENDPFRGFAAWAITDYVGVYGLQHPQQSLWVLAYLTELFSAEFAIRFFIMDHYSQTYQQLLLWAEHESEHIRRLASEGSRPRLPWGIRLSCFCDDPMPLIPILEKLKDDESEYVRRSVANNLNDIAKDHPDIVMAVCKRWQKNASKNTQWIIKHASRTLVKNGYPGVFSLLGHTDKPQINIENLQIDKKQINLGDSIHFEFSMLSTSKKTQSMVLDYKVHHMKANGKTSAKVFKLKNVLLAPDESLLIRKKQLFKAISTRRYYSGEHRIELLVNGVAQCAVDFYLNV